MRRSGSARRSGDKRKDFKKKEPSAPAGDDANKKPPREVNNAERAKSTYSKVPPPDATKDKQCKYCFTRMWHTPDRCYTGCRDANVPPDFHKIWKNSKYENEVKNAKMREYNIMHRFDKHKMGITTEEWLKLPEAKQQQVAASAEVKDKLAAELSSLQAAGSADGGKAQRRRRDQMMVKTKLSMTPSWTNPASVPREAGVCYIAISGRQGCATVNTPNI
ncbi:hypothetical protein CYMTET_5932 [Cymbomonas tetramitiformis]|uniref:Uncharacterized protein n=1 Tax=Cymbomonas tetramitiformis TaxID=36881 RepID=A0AAE0GYG4_9CHLO|nr:hypothetical protein CYMTET_5932 [Cymbomonas tetramitiformis]